MAIHIPTKFTTIKTVESLQLWIDEIKKEKLVAFDTETTGLNPNAATLVGISIAVGPPENNRAAYIPLAHVCGNNMDLQTVLGMFRPILADGSIRKVLHNAAYDMTVMAKYGTTFVNVHDTMLMAYVIHGGRQKLNMDDLASKHLDYKTIKFDDVVIPELGVTYFGQVAVPHATAYAAEDSAVTLAMYYVFRDILKKEGLTATYLTVDKEMCHVTSDMKIAGVRVDIGKLRDLDSDWRKRIKAVEKDLAPIVGSEDVGEVLRSPKKLAKLLFEDRKLPVFVRTDSGSPSTSAKALDKLAGDEVVDKLLQWRLLSKLTTTYTKPLQEKADPYTDRIFCDVRPTTTITGRLSCSDPNMQNIPARSKEGQEFRTAFVAHPGHKLIVGDYSQIELRILAHVTGSEMLLDAFKNGEDIHTRTASEMFGVALDQVPKDLRATAKTINFGIVYGIGPPGLAYQTKKTVAEAKDFIRKYFKAIPEFEPWKEDTISFARKYGYSETLFGRRVYTSLIHSDDYWEAGGAERLAVNGVIQGTAADLMRLALVTTRREILKDEPNKMGVRPVQLLLSVHDEILLEAIEDKAQHASNLLKRSMETCADDLIQWAVPITVEPKIADNWGEK